MTEWPAWLRALYPADARLEIGEPLRISDVRAALRGRSRTPSTGGS